MFKVGEKFYYYGDDENLHGNLGEVIERIRDYDEKEYRCTVVGARHYKYLPRRKMKKEIKTPDWEV